jgi:hypothetical protein
MAPFWGKKGRRLGGHFFWHTVVVVWGTSVLLRDFPSYKTAAESS